MDKFNIFTNNDNAEIGNDVYTHFNHEKNRDDDDHCDDDNEEYNIH